MNSLLYSNSVQERANSAFGNKMIEYNQERQIATAHFEEEKKELVDPLSFIGGGMATKAAEGIGKKIAGKTGIKAFESLGKESFSTTAQNAAREALTKGKDAVTKTAKQAIDDAVNKGKDAVSQGQTAAEQALEQAKSAAKSAVPEVPEVPEFPSLEDVKPAESLGLNDLKPNIEDISPEDEEYLKDILGRFPEEFQTGIETVDSSIRSGAEQAGTGLRGDSTLARALGEARPNPSHLSQLADDELPNAEDINDMAQSEGDQGQLARDLAKQTTPGQTTPEPEPEPEDKTPTAEEPTPDSDPVPEVEDEDALKAGEETGSEEATSVLSKVTKAVGIADEATGGLDIGGDVLEGALGLASLILPSILDKAPAAPAAPVSDFIGSYSGGTGVV